MDLWLSLAIRSSVVVVLLRHFTNCQVEKEMADVVGQAEEKERKMNRSRRRLEKKLVGFRMQQIYDRVT